MDFSKDFSHVESESRDPELEEEFLNRDWPEVSKSLKGTKLTWKQIYTQWNTSGGLYDRGPRWFGVPDPNPYRIQYEVWAQRTLHENWRGDYYEYSFNCFCRFLGKEKSKKVKDKPLRIDTLGQEDTLIEAQGNCERHYISEYA
jgi:hypothetical protein